MAWTPAQKIIDARFIGRNILQYVKDSDAEALSWANDNNSLKEFQQFSESIANRANPIFPSIAIVDDGNGTLFDSDLLQSAYEITLEVMIAGATAADVPLLAKRYAYALESMLANIPKASLLSGVSNVTAIRFDGLETGFDELKTNEMQNQFMQMFQTKAIYTFFTGSQ